MREAGSTSPYGETAACRAATPEGCQRGIPRLSIQGGWASGGRWGGRHMLTPRGIVQAFGGGEALRDGALVPGPGHKRGDKSLRVFIDPSAPDGFRTHSFSPADDPLACRD